MRHHTPSIHAVITQSGLFPDCVSIKVRKPDGTLSGTYLREALTTAGFQVGDEVVITLSKTVAGKEKGSGD